MIFCSWYAQRNTRLAQGWIFASPTVILQKQEIRRLLSEHSTLQTVRATYTFNKT